MKIRLQDLSRAEMLNSQYDIAFFGLGYEPRCTYVSKLIDIRNVHETIILSFNESAQNKSRLLSSDILQKKWASKLSIVNLEHSHIHEVYAVLNNKLSK
ncbi:hypothetical protein AB9C23_11200, partial [Citrobacter freundii]